MASTSQVLKLGAALCCFFVIVKIGVRDTSGGVKIRVVKPSENGIGALLKDTEIIRNISDMSGKQTRSGQVRQSRMRS